MFFGLRGCKTIICLFDLLFPWTLCLNSLCVGPCWCKFLLCLGPLCVDPLCVRASFVHISCILGPLCLNALCFGPCWCKFLCLDPLCEDPCCVKPGFVYISSVVALTASCTLSALTRAEPNSACFGGGALPLKALVGAFAWVARPLFHDLEGPCWRLRLGSTPFIS